MPVKDRKTPPHLYARERLLRAIAKLTASGERSLPPERALCAEIGVSLGTVKKALKGLAAEGRVLCAPRKGYVISSSAPAPNIGIVIGDGAAVTFLRSHEVMRSILEVLEGYRCIVRLIQLRRPEQAPQLFKHYRIDACIWYMPEQSLFTKISHVMDSSAIPIAVNILTYEKSDEPNLPKNCFYLDFKEIGRIRTAYLLTAGHTNIVFCGERGSRSYEGHCLALANAGVEQNTKWILPKIKDIPERLQKLLDANEVTAIVSHGGANRLETLFRTIEKHPRGGKVKLLVDDVGHALKDLMASYPKVKIAGVSHTMDKETGRAAAQAIVRALQHGTPMRSETFTSRIVPPK